MKIYSINIIKIFIMRFINKKIIAGLIIPVLMVTSCRRVETIEDSMLNDPTSYFYIDFADYPADRASLPVGIFDSGTGGLAVLNDIVEYKCSDNESLEVFKTEKFIYLADMANMPYGSYALEGNIELLREHIIKNVQFLLGRKYYTGANAVAYNKDKSPVKAIVIACNTATAFGLGRIESFLGRADIDIPVIGVIDAAATGLAGIYSAEEGGSIAVLATDGTVRSGAYVAAIGEKFRKQGHHNDIYIFQQAGIGIAEAIDENKDFIDRTITAPREVYMGPSDNNENAPHIDISIWQRYGFDIENAALLYEGTPEKPYNIQINSVENYVAFHLVSLMEKIRNTDSSQPLKHVVLGCTHYPYVKDAIVEVFKSLWNYSEYGEYIYRPYMADEIRLINPSVKVARQLYELLRGQSLLADNHYKESSFYIAVPNVLNEHVELRADGSFTYEYKYGRTAGEIREYVKRIPFSPNVISAEIQERLSRQVPTVYEMLGAFI